ncbi:MAG: hypothetical protein AB1405_08805 [Bdellovibrionota bacterium]
MTQVPQISGKLAGAIRESLLPDALGQRWNFSQKNDDLLDHLPLEKIDDHLDHLRASAGFRRFYRVPKAITGLWQDDQLDHLLRSGDGLGTLGRRRTGAQKNDDHLAGEDGREKNFGHLATFIGWPVLKGSTASAGGPRKMVKWPPCSAEERHPDITYIDNNFLNL